VVYLIRYIKLRLIYAGLIVFMGLCYVLWLARIHPVEKAACIGAVVLLAIFVLVCIDCPQ